MMLPSGLVRCHNLTHTCCVAVSGNINNDSTVYTTMAPANATVLTIVITNAWRTLLKLQTTGDSRQQQKAQQTCQTAQLSVGCLSQKKAKPAEGLVLCAITLLARPLNAPQPQKRPLALDSCQSRQSGGDHTSILQPLHPLHPFYLFLPTVVLPPNTSMQAGKLLLRHRASACSLQSKDKRRHLEPGAANTTAEDTHPLTTHHTPWLATLGDLNA